MRNEGCLKSDTREVAPDADEPILGWCPGCTDCPDIGFGSSIPGRMFDGNLCSEFCEILDILQKNENKKLKIFEMRQSDSEPNSTRNRTSSECSYK